MKMAEKKKQIRYSEDLENMASKIKGIIFEDRDDELKGDAGVLIGNGISPEALFKKRIVLTHDSKLKELINYEEEDVEREQINKTVKRDPRARGLYQRAEKNFLGKLINFENAKQKDALEKLDIYDIKNRNWFRVKDIFEFIKKKVERGENRNLCGALSTLDTRIYKTLEFELLKSMCETIGEELGYSESSESVPKEVSKYLAALFKDVCEIPIAKKIIDGRIYIESDKDNNHHWVRFESLCNGKFTYAHVPSCFVGKYDTAKEQKTWGQYLPPKP